MRDGLWNFGDTTCTTSGTGVASTDYADLGEPGSRPDRKTIPGDAYVCFRNKTKLHATETAVHQLLTDSGSNFATALETFTFPQAAAGLPAGTILRYRCPTDLKQYVRTKSAVTASGGTLDADVTIESWIELGPNR